MAQRKRPTKRKASSKRDRSHPQRSLALSEPVQQLAKALDALPLPARALFDQQLGSLDKFRRQYPRLYDVMFKNVDSRHYREFERHLERVQERKRGG